MVDKEMTNESLLIAPSQRTLSDYIADQLRQAILAEQFKPGERLVEQELAESMKTSRGPVRDALRLLENEGLVVRYSHRGAFVASLSLKDLIEIYTIREALETLAIKFAIHKATSRQIEDLEDLVQSMENLAKQDYNQIEATDMDLEFHRMLCKISGHKRLLATWEALSAQIRLLLLRHRLWNPDDWKDRAVTWHMRVVEAMRQRDTDLAVEELHRHLAASFEGIQRNMEKEQQESEPGT